MLHLVIKAASLIIGCLSEKQWIAVCRKVRQVMVIRIHKSGTIHFVKWENIQ